MDINALVQQATAAVEHLEDQTKVQEGGFERETPPEGMTPARFIGYVELGMRKQKPFQGKPKPDAEMVRCVFELNGKKHKKEIEVEGEKKTITNVISVTISKKLNDKAGFTKLFKKMAYGRDGIKHMAQMLGEGFLIRIVHNTVPATKDFPERTYANMKDEDGSWLIQSPMHEDPISGETTAVPIPEPSRPMQLLLWNAPSKEQWESLFIDGTRTVKLEDGSEKEVSNNWLQRSIVTEAQNFEGSPLQTMLGGVGDLDLEEDEDGDVLDDSDSGAESGSQDEKSEEGSASEKEQKTTDKGDPGPSDDADDVLARLGL